jgi:hypothetical protein
MKQQQPELPTFALCLDNRGYEASLEPGKLYQVLPEISAARASFMRVIDESREDYLYPKRMFALVRLPIKVRQRLVAVLSA